MPYSYVWEYEVLPDRVDEFESLYGPGGGWVELFKRYKGYTRTLLLKDEGDPLRYVTIDIWESREAFDFFRMDADRAFRLLDEQGERLTASERNLGSFELIG